MPEYGSAALGASAGYAASVLGMWIRVHGRSTMARIRSADRREVVRGLPSGSRVVDEQDKITIEIGQRDAVDQQPIALAEARECEASTRNLAERRGLHQRPR